MVFHYSSWSDREIRTLLARLYTLPLEWGVVRYFEEMVTNCSHNFNAEPRETKPFPLPTILYERYHDSNMPKVTKQLVVEHCPQLHNTMLKQFTKRQKYKFTINPKTAMHSNFKMLTSNVTQVIDALDELRKSPK